jgi:hypothetical protein
MQDHMDHIHHIGTNGISEIKEMKIERNDNDKIWEDFVVEESKLLAEDETKLFDAIMDAGAAARLRGVKFPYRKYIKDSQMERFNERLQFRTFLLKRHGN